MSRYVHPDKIGVYGFGRGAKTRLGEAKRAAILDYVAANPGTTKRGVWRGTGFAGGTCTYHLNRLLRDGKLVERPYGPSHLLFLPKAAPQPAKTARVVLTVGKFAPLWDFVIHNPAATQKAVLDAMQAQAKMPRSTTQHRLQRMVAAGVLAVRPYGVRALAYEAVTA